jgi:hypothetical protein
MADKKAFLLRVDPGVWTAILRLAQAELRSMNAEIEFLLRDALARRGIVPKKAPPKPKAPRATEAD